ncbi:hypothetical protein MKW92_047479 [Papaver armeniacum]|nr:hypothetical protein MKW92_047479 [Papaver armeniacum]
MEKQQGSAPAETQRPPMPKAAPWLVFPHGKGRKFQSFYNPCEPNTRNCIKSVPEMRGRAYYHKSCHQGWLIVIGNVEDNTEYSVAESNLDDCFLWNPVSSEIVQLPNLDRRSFSTESKKYFMFDLVLSSPPTCNPDNEANCTVFLIFRGMNGKRVSRDTHILVFCRPGDKEWRTKELDGRFNPDGDFSEFIDSLLCFQGKLYAFCCDRDWVNEIDIQKLWHHVVVDKQTQFLTKFKVEVPDFPLIGGGEEFSVYTEDWVESGNEIFKVFLNCNTRGYKKVASTHIFKLDFSSMTWVLLKSLDDHVLFLCTNMDMLDLYSRKCYSTSSAYCSAADMGLERGCLFYTLPGDQTLYVYEVEDNATTIILPCLEIPTPCFMPIWIMMPTTENRKVAGRRRRVTDLLVSQDTTETSIEEEDMSRQMHIYVISQINTVGLAVKLPPQTSGSPQGLAGAGGGHGGRGASCLTDKTKVQEDVWRGYTYGLSALDKLWSYGSKGGSTGRETDLGGHGAGRIEIVVKGFPEVNGRVLAKGGVGGHQGGGYVDYKLLSSYLLEEEAIVAQKILVLLVCSMMLFSKAILSAISTCQLKQIRWRNVYVCDRARAAVPLIWSRYQDLVYRTLYRMQLLIHLRLRNRINSSALKLRCELFLCHSLFRSATLKTFLSKVSLKCCSCSLHESCSCPTVWSISASVME